MSTAEEMLNTLRMIRDDCETDAAKPVPFTALGVGTIHGEMLAMISALAGILVDVIEQGVPK